MCVCIYIYIYIYEADKINLSQTQGLFFNFWGQLWDSELKLDFRCLLNLRVLTVEKGAWLFLRRMRKDQLLSPSACTESESPEGHRAARPLRAFMCSSRNSRPQFHLVCKGRENHQIPWIEGTFLLSHLLG